MRFRMSEYQARRTVIILLFIMGLLSSITAMILNLNPILTLGAAIATLSFAGLFLAYQKGGSWTNIARYLAVTITTILIIVVLVGDKAEPRMFSPGFFAPPVIALIMLGWEGILLSSLALFIAVSIGLPSPNPYLDPIRIGLTIVIFLSLAAARLTMDTMRQHAEDEAHAALKAQQEAEQEAENARQQAEQLKQQTTEQQRLLELVTELDAPVVTIAENVLLMPIIGALDKHRAETITRRLLNDVSQRRTKLVILDMAGLNNVDTATAQELYRLINAIRLLGCKVTITSISSAIAIALTQLGISMDAFETARSPQEVLTHHVNSKISHN